MSGGDKISRLFRHRMRQIKRRFVGLMTACLDDDFFGRHEASVDWMGLSREGFPRTAGAAYDLRSKYLHTGATFGGWVRPRNTNEERQGGEPIVDDSGMAKILAHAPTYIGLERITRVLLLKCAEMLGATLPLPGGEPKMPPVL